MKTLTFDGGPSVTVPDLPEGWYVEKDCDTATRKDVDFSYGDNLLAYARYVPEMFFKYFRRISYQPYAYEAVYRQSLGRDWTRIETASLQEAIDVIMTLIRIGEFDG